MLFGARDEHFPPLPSPPPALPPTTEPPVKKKKRDPKAPHCEYVGNRLYDSQLGVTCHWCRQKTVEVHAICTRRECAEQVTPKGEIRARLPVAFCGPCLKNRNGEDVVAAVASGTWICPKCRGSCGPGCDGCCNCGPCRRRKGLPHTGQLAPEARERGFTNAHDYLVHLATGESQVELLRRKKSHWWGAWLIAPGERSSPNATMSFPAARTSAAHRRGTLGAGGRRRRSGARRTGESDTRLRRRFHDRGGGGRASRAGECAGHDDGGYDQRVGVRRDEGADPSNVHRCRMSSFCFFARRRIPTRA